MAWWRRDPSLFSRSPVHRYAQRVLRDNEAALRTRCFSRTPSKSAQHEDSNDRKRPDNMSNLEWMQLQHYNRWRKRLEDDPYRTLFGASNNMLSGKGLMDWEWIHKTFPKWMLNEMEVEEKPQEKSQEKTKYPPKVEIRDETLNTLPKAREPLFPEPSFRKTTFERDASAGIVSPSDLRRPRESSHVKVVGAQPQGAAVKAFPTASEAASGNETTVPISRDVPDPPNFSRNPVEITEERVVTSQEGHEEDKINAALEAATARFRAAFRESYQKAVPSSENPIASQHIAAESYATELQGIHPTSKGPWEEAPLVESYQNKSPSNVVTSDANDWRQTALQRRSASELMAKPSSPSLMLSKSADATASGEHVLPVSLPQTTDAIPEQPSRENKPERADLTDPPKEPATKDHIPQHRSSSDILKQLPQDDIDFLSAAEIRANMRAKRRSKPTDQQRQAERQNLEDAFTASKETPSVDSMVEAQIINNQLVRRKAREMGFTESVEEEKVANLLKEVPPSSPAQAPVESSIDRMKKWLETTGASFAKQFWQDPTEEADVTKTRLFFDKIANYLKKGQSATRHITEDLEKDVPASIPLLKRLKTDEQLLESAIHRLRQRLPSGTSQGLSPRKIRAMESFKTRFHHTNNELEKAYEALRVLAGTDVVTNATGSMKRRLTAASKVLSKNGQLLRMLIWSLQTRLEDPKIDRGILANYKVVADNLLSLRDTQMTLVRLVDRAMLVYGVVPNAAESINAIEAEHSAEYENCEDPFVRARLAADAHLINEIKAHKSVKESITQDKSTPISKLATSTTLDEPNPLAHSLFRPFGPAVEKLGSKEVQEQIKEDERRKLSDAKLVNEVKQAYEDTYGKITAEHRQVAPAIVEFQHTEKGAEKPIQMLKDDPEATAAESKDDSPVTTTEPSVAPTTIDDSAMSPEVVNEVENYDVASEKSTSLKTGDEAVSTTSSAEPTTATEPATLSPAARSVESLPTHYTIVVYDPQTDTLSITTSTTGPPRDTSPVVPLHQALSALDSPAKFIPYITEGLEVVSAKKDILVLRDAIDSTASTRPFDTVRPASSNSVEQPDVARDTVNPIDGTTRLSPTGYVGPEESAEQLEKEFQDRRQAAGNMSGKERAHQDQPKRESKRVKRKGAGGVVKTAIWVAGMCYIAGVVGEIATGA